MHQSHDCPTISCYHCLKRSQWAEWHHTIIVWCCTIIVQVLDDYRACRIIIVQLWHNYYAFSLKVESSCNLLKSTESEKRLWGLGILRDRFSSICIVMVVHMMKATLYLLNWMHWNTYGHEFKWPTDHLSFECLIISALFWVILFAFLYHKICVCIDQGLPTTSLIKHKWKIFSSPLDLLLCNSASL